MMFDSGTKDSVFNSAYFIFLFFFLFIIIVKIVNFSDMHRFLLGLMVVVGVESCLNLGGGGGGGCGVSFFIKTSFEFMKKLIGCLKI